MVGVPSYSDDVRPSPRPAKPGFDPASAVVLAVFALLVAVVASTRGVPPWAALLHAGASLLCFILYGVDKAAARAGRDRISESTLLSLGWIGGWPGAVVAQQVFRHKTSKRSFRVRFWLSVAANVGLWAWAAMRAVG